MNKICFILFLCFSTLCCIAQERRGYCYQVVMIDPDKDRINDQRFVRILTEPATDVFPEFSNLVYFSSRRAIPNKPAAFYTGTESADSSYYNYFPNLTQALNYIAKHDWELVSVVEDSMVGYRLYRVPDGKPRETSLVYYFRKPRPAP